MPTAVAQIRTDKAARYIAQLCRHFRHKVPATWDDTSGQANFATGSCRMAADGSILTLTCQAETEDGLQRVRLIVDDHIRRFAWRERPAVTWDSSDTCGDGHGLPG